MPCGLTIIGRHMFFRRATVKVQIRADTTACRLIPWGQGRMYTARGSRPSQDKMHMPAVLLLRPVVLW
jgi:hypothetical protein